ncbi:V-type ATP synthase subunit D [bacterium]|nr:V-type ATP synthase subunit D [bacterium]MBU1634266.1 V-type ATP synthase subunit D [bacterium]MBU1872153.1 V-type ATP synthase subunit D [bacterium]
MAKIRLTKNELKKQKEALKRFTRYLPTLELKKTQLVAEIRLISQQVDKIIDEINRFEKEIFHWVDVFGEDIDISVWFSVEELVTNSGNIAGIDIEIFENVIFKDEEYDLFETPLWVDKGIEACKEKIRQQLKIKTLEKQMAVLQEELRITVQRINLFDKVKIPEARENIRVIQIYLGDERTSEVVRGKISKAKIQKKKELAAA